MCTCGVSAGGERSAGQHAAPDDDDHATRGDRIEEKRQHCRRRRDDDPRRLQPFGLQGRSVQSAPVARNALVAAPTTDEVAPV